MGSGAEEVEVLEVVEVGVEAVGVEVPVEVGDQVVEPCLVDLEPLCTPDQFTVVQVAEA